MYVCLKSCSKVTVDIKFFDFLNVYADAAACLAIVCQSSFPPNSLVSACPCLPVLFRVSAVWLLIVEWQCQTCLPWLVLGDTNLVKNMLFYSLLLINGFWFEKDGFYRNTYIK